MSALLGLIRYEGKPVEASDIMPSMDWLAFYGPDGSHTETLGGAVFGHQTLFSTRQSEAERLPVLVDSRWLITADARLDNRADLMDQLGLDDPDLPDSLLIVRAYQKWGRSCPAHLLGDFAFALWDQEERRLLLARDHIGTKPLYYYRDNDAAAFGSEIEPLLLLPDVPDVLDEQEVTRFLLARTVAYHSNHNTFYKGVFRVPFGTTVLITPHGESIERYWFPEEIAPLPKASEAEYAEELRRLVDQAVDCRINTRYPIGSHLSGGLDSSALAILAGHKLHTQGNRLKAYSWSPPPHVVEDTSDTEICRVQIIAEQENLDIRYIDRVALFSNPPVPPDYSLRAVHTLQYERMVGQLAKDDGIRIMLSGWGGDEFITFNGRGHRADQFRRGQWLALIRNLKGPQASFLSMEGVRNIAANFRNDVFRPLRGTEEEPEFIRPPAFVRVEADPGGRPFDRSPEDAYSARQTQLNLYYSGHIGYRMESWAWSGAEHQMMYTYPLTDRRVMAFAFGLPGSMFTNKGWNRYLFRHAFADIFPEGMTWNRYGSIKEDTTLHTALRKEINQQAREQVKESADDGDSEVDEEKREHERQLVEDNPWIDLSILRRIPPARRRRFPALMKRTQIVLTAYRAWKQRHDPATD